MLVAAPSPCVVPSVHLGPRCRPTSTISRLHAAQSPQKSSCTTNSIEFGCFTLIIDDIVSHDGTTLMGSLGGGGACVYLFLAGPLQSACSRHVQTHKQASCCYHVHIHHHVHTSTTMRTHPPPMRTRPPPTSTYAGPQTLWGYQVVTGQRGQVALAAGIGDDFPQSCGDWLAQVSGCMHRVQKCRKQHYQQQQYDVTTTITTTMV